MTTGAAVPYVTGKVIIREKAQPRRQHTWPVSRWVPGRIASTGVPAPMLTVSLPRSIWGRLGRWAHWPEDRRDTTLGVLLIRMVAETAQHAGHADIIRELIDGKGGREAPPRP
jgi:hypothetical protein